MPKILHFFPVVAIVCALVLFSGTSIPIPAKSKSPTWQPGEHPRLMATAGERDAMVTKLTANGTTSKALWQKFVSVNQSATTNPLFINYADAGVLYWVTGDAAYGQKAHDVVMNYIHSTPTYITPNIANYDYNNYFPYRDMLLNFDFAYDRFTPSERQEVYTRIFLQGAKCHATPAATSPSNVAALWALCEYASAVMLEGENFSVTVTNEPVGRQSGTKDTLRYPTNIYNISIRSTPAGPITYTAGTDYNSCYRLEYGSRCIDWSPAGSEPVGGSTYYVSYTATPQTDQWRVSSRMFLEDVMNYHWRDGTYAGGFSQYSGAALESVIDMMEIARRDLGIDYSQEPDLKKYIDMALYEWLPYDGGLYVGYRTLQLNDSGGVGEDTVNHPGENGLRGWIRRMVAWGLSRYGDDPEYSAKYLWYWGQLFRNADGTIKPYNGGDWREAFFFNDALTSGYPVTTLPTPNWPPYRFFRGRDLIVARTDHFGTPDPNAAYVSFLAGNHNYQNEHDQGDSGSFTFDSLREDWAIDPGYQQSPGIGGGSSPDHNTVGIDGAGYNATGIYGVSNSYTIPAYGGFSHMDHVALTEGASAMKADLSHAWSLTTTPFVDHQYRYLAMVNGGPATYLVVGDDVQKDASTHSYQWYFSAGPGNGPETNGSITSFAGVQTGAAFDIHTISPGATTSVIQDWSVGNAGGYMRLTLNAASTINPYFLNLLIPTPNGGTKPTVTQANITNGVRAIVAWPNGMVDTIFWRTGSSVVSDTTFSTDAALTIVRDTSGSMTGLIVMDGRTVVRQGTTIFSALDGERPVTFSSFDSTAAISGADISHVQVNLPQITDAHISDGQGVVDVAHNGDTTYLTAALPFDIDEQHTGNLLAEHFDNTYVHNLVSTNFQRYPVTEQAVNNGVLDVSPTGWDWVSLSRRDSTVWRRTGLTPNTIPPDTFGDGTYNWRFRFTDATDAARKMKFYFMVHDRNAIDWETNQDYLRLEFSPAAGQVTIGQRINGAWTTVDSNDVLTSTTATVAAAMNDASWHTAALRVDGDTVTLTLDGSQLYSGAVNGSLPTPGYLQWRANGTSHVQIDDLVITANDHISPIEPSGGAIVPQGADGAATILYNHGLSPDVNGVRLYQSNSVIAPDADPATLTLVAQGADPRTITVTPFDRLSHYAALVTDTAGNRSQLTSLRIDNTPPAAVTDLQTQ